MTFVDRVQSQLLGMRQASQRLTSCSSLHHSSMTCFRRIIGSSDRHQRSSLPCSMISQVPGPCASAVSSIEHKVDSRSITVNFVLYATHCSQICCTHWSASMPVSPNKDLSRTWHNCWTRTAWKRILVLSNITRQQVCALGQLTSPSMLPAAYRCQNPQTTA